jgi:ribokinase
MSGSIIAVLGSANMDLVVTVDRAPERGETVAGRTFSTVPGGKGANQALAAARAGGSVIFAGAVGADEFGRQIADLLDDAGIDTAALATQDEPTGTAHIIVDGAGDNSIVVVPGANGTVTTLTDRHRAMIDQAAVLMLQLELALDLVAEAAAYAHQRGVRVVLTPAPAMSLPEALLDHVDLLVPNAHEAVAVAGGGTDPLAAARALARRCRGVVVTMGSRGAVHVAGGETTTVAAFPVDPVDTTAGDTFAGVLAVGLAEGLDLPRALRRASAGAALAVQRFGASSSMPARAEIEAFLAGQEVHADG